MYNHIRISFIASFGWKWTIMDPYTCYRCWKSSVKSLTSYPRSSRPKNLQEPLDSRHPCRFGVSQDWMPKKKILSNSCEVEKDIWKLKVVNFPARNPTTIDKMVVEEPIWNIRSWNRIDIVGPQILRHGMVWPWPYYLGWAEFFQLTLGGVHQPKKKVLFEDSCSKVNTSGLKISALQLHFISLSCWWHELGKSV